MEINPHYDNTYCINIATEKIGKIGKKFADAHSKIGEK